MATPEWPSEQLLKCRFSPALAKALRMYDSKIDYASISFRKLLLLKAQECAPHGVILRTTRPANRHNFINVLGNILSESTMADLLDNLDALTLFFRRHLHWRLDIWRLARANC